MERINTAIDNRSDCISVLYKMTLKEYRNLVYDSFKEGGNLEGQRGVIKRSAAAAKIRKRMQDDFTAGAVFPQVVIGLRCEEEDFEKFKKEEEINLSTIGNERFSIIDGIQRSNIYFMNYEGNEEREIRVEFWIACKTEKLLYRMMVLNTGQVPWNTRRQVEVIFSNLSDSILTKLIELYPELKGKVEILGIDDGKRRTQAGRYNKSSIIECYLAFNTRKIKVNITDELASEYQRFDMMESIEKDDSFLLFVKTLGLLCKLDLAFSEYETGAVEDTETENKREVKEQFRTGKDIFTSIPACVGFIVSCAEYIMGKASIERTTEIKEEKYSRLQEQVEEIIVKLGSQKDSRPEYLRLDVLNSMCNDLRKSNIGEETRRLFKDAFTEMLRYDEFNEIPSLETFWRN